MSPLSLPHAAPTPALLVLMALILATAVGAFLLVRRYSLAHPRALNQIVADQAQLPDAVKRIAAGKKPVSTGP